MQLISQVTDTCWQALNQVHDPEIPVLTVLDLGMIRGVDINADNEIVVRLTPTYSGCPATDMLKDEITSTFTERGLTPVKVVIDLSEAWTTDWMSEAGKQKLQEYGIAPPQGDAHSCGTHMVLTDGVTCSHCHSQKTQLISEFGSTACKAFYKCLDCLEPFDYFKCK